MDPGQRLVLEVTYDALYRSLHKDLAGEMLSVGPCQGVACGRTH